MNIETATTVIVTNEDVDSNGRVELKTPIRNVRSIHCNRFRFLHNHPTYIEDYQITIYVLYTGEGANGAMKEFVWTIPKGFYNLPPPGSDHTWVPAVGENLMKHFMDSWNNDLTHPDFPVTIDSIKTSQRNYQWEIVFDISAYQTAYPDRVPQGIEVRYLPTNSYGFTKNDLYLQIFGGIPDSTPFTMTPTFLTYTFPHDQTAPTLCCSDPANLNSMELGSPHLITLTGVGGNIPVVPTQSNLLITLPSLENNTIVVSHQETKQMENVVLSIPTGGMLPGWNEKPYQLDESVYFHGTRTIMHFEIHLSYLESRKEITRNGIWSMELIFR